MWRADVQGLRAIAVLMVVAYHADLPVPGGFVGVDVFFVISGFVITRLLVGELEHNNRIDFAKFYARRTRRLLPALAIMSIVVVLASALLLGPFGPQQATQNTSIGASLFGANLQLLEAPSGYFDPVATSNALLHTWSLSVEEQFYLMFPFALALVWRASPRPTSRRLVGFLGIATTLSFALCMLVSNGRGSTLAHLLGTDLAKVGFYSPFTRAWEFGAGALVSFTVIRSRVLAEFAAWLGLVCVVSGATTISGVGFPGIAALLPVGGAALLLVAGASTISRVLAVRPLVWLGNISYGWYLWHWPLIAFARAAFPGSRLVLVTSVAALIPAALSFRWIEQPMRANQSIVGRRAIALVAISIVGSSLVAIAMRCVSTAAANSRAARPVAQALRFHEDRFRHCDSLDSRPECTWGSGDRELVLVGDSYAGQLTEGLAAAAARVGLRFRVATSPGCPFVDANVRVDRHDPRGCREFVAQTVAWIVKRHPAIVFVASAHTTYLRGAAIYDVDGQELVEEQARLHAWSDGIRTMVEPLSRAGIATTLVVPTPLMDAVHLDTCPLFRILWDTRACAGDESRVVIDGQLREVNVALGRAATLPNVTTLDATPDLCDASRCFERSGDRWIYRDSGHLSVDGALLLVDRFEREIRMRIAR